MGVRPQSRMKRKEDLQLGCSSVRQDVWQDPGAVWELCLAWIPWQGGLGLVQMVGLMEAFEPAVSTGRVCHSWGLTCEEDSWKPSRTGVKSCLFCVFFGRGIKEPVTPGGDWIFWMDLAGRPSRICSGCRYKTAWTTEGRMAALLCPCTPGGGLLRQLS